MDMDTDMDADMDMDMDMDIPPQRVQWIIWERSQKKRDLSPERVPTHVSA